MIVYVDDWKRLVIGDNYSRLFTINVDDWYCLMMIYEYWCWCGWLMIEYDSRILAMINVIHNNLDVDFYYFAALPSQFLSKAVVYWNCNGRGGKSFSDRYWSWMVIDSCCWPMTNDYAYESRLTTIDYDGWMRMRRKGLRIDDQHGLIIDDRWMVDDDD
jgi:hypothetical protein